MTAHSSGSGSSWNETLDVDQPHGLDYQEWVDIRIGVRKRMAQEHASFADSTAGGIHKPGGAAILGIDDDTATVVADGTYRGHGLVWDGSVNLWCWTKTAGITDTPGVAGTEDWTILKMHPDKQWGGQDVTWSADHAFAGSVCVAGGFYADSSADISGAVNISGDVTINGKLIIDSSADFSDVYVEGDISIDGILKVDGTATEFGGTEGVALFYDPTAQAGAESITFPTDLIIKHGFVADPGAVDTKVVNFGAAFPTAIVSGQVTLVGAAAGVAKWSPLIKLAVGSLTLYTNNADSMGAFYWQAIGY